MDALIEAGIRELAAAATTAPTLAKSDDEARNSWWLGSIPFFGDVITFRQIDNGLGRRRFKKATNGDGHPTSSPTPSNASSFVEPFDFSSPHAMVLNNVLLEPYAFVNELRAPQNMIVGHFSPIVESW